MSSSDGWTPRELPGGIYCSPRCGCDCTRQDHDRAEALAIEMARKLGSGWKPHHWENGGWHSRAEKGVAYVTANFGFPPRLRQVESYSVFINSSECGQTIVDAADPVEALGLAMQEARTKCLRFEAELNAISNEEATTA